MSYFLARSRWPPDGWVGKAIADGCSVQTPDGANALVVQFFPANQMTAMEAAKMMADMVKMTISSEKDEGSAAFLDGNKDGTPWAVLMVKEETMLMAVQFAGKERDKMMEIYKTVKGK